MYALKFAVTGLALLLSLNAFAANVPSDFDSAKWDQLVAKVFASQNVIQLQSGELRFLSQIVPADLTKDHHSQYVSALGNYDEKQKYVATDISAVDEDWKLDGENNWTIDQWTYHMSLTGDLKVVVHSRIVEKDGVVLSFGEMPVGSPADAAELQRWGTLLNQWTSGL